MPFSFISIGVDSQEMSRRSTHHGSRCTTTPSPPPPPNRGCLRIRRSASCRISSTVRSSAGFVPSSPASRLTCSRMLSTSWSCCCCCWRPHPAAATPPLKPEVASRQLCSFRRNSRKDDSLVMSSSCCCWASSNFSISPTCTSRKCESH
uniref:(northern house mosquito) hypothetical protein n=1 Tax=Culex pipiens TaxID=7175 RepID=A0A8D8AAK8_CULPI